VGSGCSSATVVTITKPIPLPKKNNSLYPHADQLPRIHRFYPNNPNKATSDMNTAAQISRTEMKHTHSHTHNMNYDIDRHPSPQGLLLTAIVTSTQQRHTYSIFSTASTVVAWYEPQPHSFVDTPASPLPPKDGFTTA